MGRRHGNCLSDVIQGVVLLKDCDDAAAEGVGGLGGVVSKCLDDLNQRALPPPELSSNLFFFFLVSFPRQINLRVSRQPSIGMVTHCHNIPRRKRRLFAQSQ